MTQTSPIQTQQIPHELRLSAAERLVSAPGRRDAARRLIASASSHGIDLNLMWGVIENPERSSPNPKKARPRVRQTVLAVLGAGRTAMLFLPTPDPADRTLGTAQTQRNEIAASIQACLEGLRAWAPAKVTLGQTLVSENEQWAHSACIEAGMRSVGTLDYLRKPVTLADLTGPPPNWPGGIEVRAMDSIQADRSLLIEALEGSYEQTLDCPELCGLRSMEDVVDSHMATGEFDPSRWHLVFKDGQPAGCCLLSHCPPNNTVELVYIGIAPIARGLGLGQSLLTHAIGSLGPMDITEVTCAVDNRNAPALRIYDAMGFERFDARVGFVSSITARA